MPITKDGNGRILYSPPVNERQFELTGTINDADFAIADTQNALKQVQFTINPTSVAPGVLTLQCDIAGDSTLNLTNLANAGTVSTVSVVTANGISGTVATATTTPALTLALGAITPTTIVATGAISGTNLSGTNTGDMTLGAFGSTPSSTGASLSGQALTLQPADATNPGSVSTTTQTLAGNKTFTGTLAGSNLSGTNTGDVTLGAFGSAPSATGASLANQVVTLQPADATHPGAVSITTQTLAGDKTLSGATTLTGAATFSSTLNKVTITPPASAATLTLANGSSLITAGAFATTLTSSATSNATLPAGTNTLQSSLKTQNTQSGTTYTLALADGSGPGLNPLVTFGSGSATTVTVPTNGSVAFPVGTQLDCLQLGAGKVTFAAAGGVTLNSQSGNLSIAAQYVAVTLIKTASDTWVLIGNLIA